MPTFLAKQIVFLGLSCGLILPPGLAMAATNDAFLSETLALPTPVSHHSPKDPIAIKLIKTITNQPEPWPMTGLSQQEFFVLYHIGLGWTYPQISEASSPYIFLSKVKEVVFNLTERFNIRIAGDEEEVNEQKQFRLILAAHKSGVVPNLETTRPQLLDAMETCVSFKFSTMEKAIFQLLRRDLSKKEIGRRLSQSPSLVRSAINRMKAKLLTDDIKALKGEYRITPLLAAALLSYYRQTVRDIMPVREKRSPTYGDIVEYHRLKKQWTQEELGLKIGVSKDVIGSIEVNRVGISLTRAKQLALIFGIDPAVLYFDRSAGKPKKERTLLNAEGLQELIATTIDSKEANRLIEQKKGFSPGLNITRYMRTKGLTAPWLKSPQPRRLRQSQTAV